MFRAGADLRGNDGFAVGQLNFTWRVVVFAMLQKELYKPFTDGARLQPFDVVDKTVQLLKHGGERLGQHFPVRLQDIHKYGPVN